jgi:serine/threonine protein kinase
VTEWVDGEPLRVVRERAERSGGIPLLVAVNLVGQVLRGLQAAHELEDENGATLGVVHRDVSLDQVLVSHLGIAKLIGFGIGRSANTRAAREPDQAPEPGCVAPEQSVGGAVDARSDLFSVGVLLYVLTTGRYPFEQQDASGLLPDLLSDEAAILPSLLKPGYPRTLESVVLKALEKKRDRRWPSAEEMRQALERGVPQAFGLGFETQLRTFMADTVGDLALLEHEALHRAEHPHGEHIHDSGSPASGPGAQSIRSLRAISIDGESMGSDSLPAPQSRRAPRRRSSDFWSAPPRRHRSVVLIAASACALSVAVWLLQKPARPTSLASSPSAGMVDLAPPGETRHTLTTNAHAAPLAALPAPSGSCGERHAPLAAALSVIHR